MEVWYRNLLLLRSRKHRRLAGGESNGDGEERMTWREEAEVGSGLVEEGR